jgi:hydrogenase nickel incorporation protein HypB
MTMRVEVVERVLRANDALAEENRAALDAAGVLALNLIGSPGSGKTAVLNARPLLRPRLRWGIRATSPPPVTRSVSPGVVPTIDRDASGRQRRHWTRICSHCADLSHVDRSRRPGHRNVGNLAVRRPTIGEHLRVVVASTEAMTNRGSTSPPLRARMP